MANYLHQISTKQTPANQPILGEDQILNDAGGYVYQLGDWERLDRFLILGSADGTYYVSQQKLTRDNAELITALLKVDGREVVRRIVDVSTAGRAPKQDPGLFALAVAASLGDDDTRYAALLALPQVARTASTLFTFLTYAQQFRGWGRGLRNAVADWYERDDLDYQLIKYRNRDGWTHRDVLRKAHPTGSAFKPRRTPVDVVGALAWAAGKGSAEGHPLLEGFEALQRAETPGQTIVILLSNPNLPREAVRPEHLNDAGVWEALLRGGMPQTALLRNLATMTKVGLLKPMGEATHHVTTQLVAPEQLRRARVHPFNILYAMKTYASGHGDRGRSTWMPVPEVIDALDRAFYASFETLEPTGKRHMLGLDVSPSMHGQTLMGSTLTAAEGVGAMAMATAAVEPHMIVGFQDQIVPLTISPRQRLDDVVRHMRDTGRNWGRTDAAQPILLAMRQKIEVDAFVMYTDNESWVGSIQPVQALRQYRQVMGIPAKLITVGMTATHSTIGDTSDSGTLDVVGFDTSAPGVINSFVGDKR